MLIYELFYAIPTKLDYSKEVKIKYGKLLLTHYPNDILNEEVQKALDELKELKHGTDTLS